MKTSSEDSVDFSPIRPDGRFTPKVSARAAPTDGFVQLMPELPKMPRCGSGCGTLGGVNLEGETCLAVKY